MSGFKMVVSSKDPSIGKRFLKWLSGKSEGNPMMPSKEKEEIKKLFPEDETEEKDDMDEKEKLVTSMKKKRGFKAAV